jgi:hypothetical protein
VDKVVISQVSTESEEEDDNSDSDKPAENGTAIEEKAKEVTNESGLEEDQAELSPDAETNGTDVENDLSEQSPTESIVPVTPTNNKKAQQLSTKSQPYPIYQYQKLQISCEQIPFHHFSQRMCLWLEVRTKSIEKNQEQGVSDEMKY